MDADDSIRIRIKKCGDISEETAGIYERMGKTESACSRTATWFWSEMGSMKWGAISNISSQGE